MVCFSRLHITLCTTQHNTALWYDECDLHMAHNWPNYALRQQARASKPDHLLGSFGTPDSIVLLTYFSPLPVITLHLSQQCLIWPCQRGHRWAGWGGGEERRGDEARGKRRYRKKDSSTCAWSNLGQTLCQINILSHQATAYNSREDVWM